MPFGASLLSPAGELLQVAGNNQTSSGALYWAGVHRLVYAASQQDIADSMGGDLLPMPSCDVLAGASRRVRVDAGPCRDRATQVLRRYR